MQTRRVAQRGFSAIEVSLLGAVFVVFMLLYWTWDTMQEHRQVDQAAALLSSVQRRADLWLDQHSRNHDIDNHDIEALSTTALQDSVAPWGEPIALLQKPNSAGLVLRLCAPTADMATALAVRLRINAPPQSSCVLLPLN
ncbi:MAG: hypothetical protein R3C68_14630 [Myxococcota bacterium]